MAAGHTGLLPHGASGCLTAMRDSTPLPNAGFAAHSLRKRMQVCGSRLPSQHRLLVQAAEFAVTNSACCWKLSVCYALAPAHPGRQPDAAILIGPCLPMLPIAGIAAVAQRFLKAGLVHGVGAYPAALVLQ